jgi:hypothetical protein
MLTTIAKRVQTRLSNRGVKVTLGEIRPVVESMVADINNSSAEEVNQVTQHFINNATKLVVISKDVTTESDATNEETSICVGGENGNIAEPTQMELETLEIEQETTEVDNGIQRVNSNLDTNLDSINSADLHPTTAAQLTEELEAVHEEEESTALATATNSELVSSTAHSLGIVLDVGEISLIAENIGTSTDSLEQDIDAIESAIMAFVEHKAMISQQKINQMVSSVRRTVQHKNSENSQLLTDGLKSINSDIQDANKDFKSNVKKALSAFTIPAIKAG